MSKPKPPTARLFYSLAEASDLTGMSPDYLRGAVASGILRAKRTGPNGQGHYKFRLADLEAWFENLDAA
jgi:excisionase family DNA binding protein